MRFAFFALLGACCCFGCAQNEPKELVQIKESNEITKEPIDSLLKMELERIGIEDQTLRHLLPAVVEKFGTSSKEEQFFWSLINRQDSICINEVSAILEEHAWLGKSRVGVEANQVLWLVIQHAELETQEKYLPLLKASVAKGESEGWHLAFLEDRILMRNKKDQLYGTQALWDKALGKNKIYPIADVKNVDSRRKKLGLEPMKE